jgi:DNA-directed RNA polymerase specialized sigma24 family protein
MGLVVLGLALLVLGVVTRSDAAGAGLIVVGAGIACLGILFPAVAESQIGPGGFTLKRAAERPADEAFVVFSQHESEHAQRLALFLTGDRPRSAELASDALARAFANWGAVSAVDPGRYVVCVVTRLALAAQTLGLVPAATPSTDEDGAVLVDALRALLSLPPRVRAVALLHHYEALSDGEIAEIVQEPLERVREDLRAGETLLAGATGNMAAGA